MAQIKHHKVVSALPSELQANSIYYVRAGSGFDVYVTNGSGMVVAYPANYVGTADARLTDAREWSATTASQPEAEEGIATTRRAWTAQRVFQAAAAWWAASAMKTKLDGIQAGAQVNVATNLAQGTRTATAVPVTSSTGSSATLAAASTTLAGVMTATDKAKLDGVATGATANATNAQLLSRANHTGTQTLATISDSGTAAAANILGTVSQSGGVPTGAIIERGSNSNGEYTRYADGTQECWIRGVSIDITTPMGALFRGIATWNYPAAFVNVTSMVVISTAANPDEWGGAGTPANINQGILRLMATTSRTGAIVDGYAIGRWRN